MTGIALAYVFLAGIWFLLFLAFTLRKEPPVNPRSHDYDPTLFP